LAPETAIMMMREVMNWKKKLFFGGETQSELTG